MTNPFSRLHGVRDPSFYAPRATFENHVGVLFGGLNEKRYARGLRLIGVRGGGKTTELLRLGHAARQQGWLAIYFSVGHIPVGGDPSERFLNGLGKALSDAIKDRGGRDPLREGRRQGTWKATGKVPAIFEFQYENKPNDKTDNKFEILRDAVHEHLVNSTPVLMLVDEADLMAVDQFEEFVVPLAHTAAVDNLPFALVTAGTTVSYLGTMNGQSTFGNALARSIELERLDVAGATDLLVQTAAFGQQDWARSNELPKLVERARGVPRLLQTAGADAFDAAPRVGVDKAIRDAAEHLSAERAGQIEIVSAGRLSRRELAVGIQQLLSDRPMTLWELESGLRDHLGLRVDYEEINEYTAILQEAGVIEAHVNGTLEYF